MIDEHPKAVEELLARVKEDESLQDVLDGLTAGFAGRHKVKAPSGWEGVQERVDNMVDPSAIIGADYRMSIVVLNDGRVLNGLVSGKTDRALTLQTANDRLTLVRHQD